jgi:hypothetical protein
MVRWRMAVVALVLLGLVGLAPGQLWATPPQQDQYVISFPGDSATVSAVVEIIGTAAHPNFNSYGVLYSPGAAPTAESQWTPIVFGVEQQVIGGSLALWDTTVLGEDGQPVVPNGVYTLALARYRDGRTEPDLYYVRNITVNNEDVTPTPEATAEPLPTAAPETPTPIPIDQPPTPTPRPTAAAAAEVPSDPAPDEPTLGDTGDEGVLDAIPIDIGELRNNFVKGARWVIVVFVLWGLYVIGKTLVRHYLRTGEVVPRFTPPWGKQE